jgi:chromosome segregation ATPase
MDSLPKVHVKEANDHLQRMFARVIELEELTKQQAAAITSRDEELASLRHDRQTLEGKNREISELREKLASSQATVERLVADMKDRDAATVALKEKARLFDNILNCKPALERIVESLRLFGGEGSSEDSGVVMDAGYQERREDEN